MSNAAETIALPSPAAPEETLPVSLAGRSGAHAVYRGGPRADVTQYGTPRPSPVHVHGASDWPDEAPTVGIAGGAPRRSRSFGLERPSPRATAPERADTKPPVARPRQVQALVHGIDPRAAADLRPMVVPSLGIDESVEARPTQRPAVREVAPSSPSRRVRAYSPPAKPHSSQLRLRKPSPEAAAARMPTVQYMPEPADTHALGFGATSLFLTAALLAGCVAGLVAFQLMIG